MSRTFKHTKEAQLKRYYKARWDDEYEKYEYWGKVYSYPLHSTEEFAVRTCFLKKAGVLTKKRKEVDSEHHWMSTPSWWNHLVHTKKRRRAAKIWEVNVLKALDLEDVDKPNESNKPHIYYY